MALAVGPRISCDTSGGADCDAELNKEIATVKHIRMFCLLLVFVFAMGTLSQGQQMSSPKPANPPQAQQPQQPASTIASVVDREISMYEKLMVDAAEAMPPDKFDFTPASLNIPGSAYKDVRTFAQLMKHTAAVNYGMWTALAGEKMPENIKGTNGPDELKTKAQILQFLKDSFAVGHRAAQTLTSSNVVEQVPFRNSTQTRLFLATFAVIHCGDEYGQAVEYLRMNGIVPPASRR
jgi:hypothetical protein